MSTHAELTARADAADAAGAPRAAESPHRLGYHFMAPAGWMNDPNGLIYWRGTHHVFYQHNPYDAHWGAMHWGHAVSADLVRYEHQPVAMAPREPYELPNGCFSGSAVDDDGTLTLIYTGAGHQPIRQTQCIATSTDGLHFEKFDGNPVIPAPPAQGNAGDFRDPKVWRHDGEWWMVVGSRDGDLGNVLLYRSGDLRAWEFVSVVCQSDGTQGTMWECPDLIPLGDPSGGPHALVISPCGVEPRKSVTMVGEFDYATGRFTPERQMDTDWGPGFYAPQSFVDAQGRRVMFGWMTATWGTSPGRAYGWAGALTLPRLMTVGPDGMPRFTPLPELESLRAEWLDPDAVAGNCLEIVAEFEAGTGGEFGLSVLRSADGAQETRVVYDESAGTLTIDYGRSGAAESGRRSAPLPVRAGERLRLHVFVDRSSVEVFADNGRAVLSARVFPDPASTGVALIGRERLASLEAWRLASIW